MKLIDKDKVVTELERLASIYEYIMPQHFREYVNSLEVKEIVELEREVKIDAAGYPYIDEIEFYDYDKDMPLAKEGDKVKVIIVKEE